MSGIRISVDLRDLDATLGQRIRRLRNARVMFAEIGEYLLGRTDENFAKEQDPRGNRWESLDERYVERKQQQRKIIKILQREGDLRGGINYQATDQSVAIGSPLPYAAIHQLGGFAGRGSRTKIAARPYLGIGERDRRVIVDIVASYLA